jgi:AcrR family transcriptional regulator
MSKTGPALSLTSQLKIAGRARDAFLRHGFDNMTMVTLAKECELTRRGLYHYFSSKEEAFRATIQLENNEGLENGSAAARKVLASKRPTAVDTIVAWLDARYGDARRNISASPFGKEVNDAAFVVCGDVMNEFAVRTHNELADLLQNLEKRKLLRIAKPATPQRIARLLADGARGVNQTRPPLPNDSLARRYREMSAAILYGTTKK